MSEQYDTFLFMYGALIRRSLKIAILIFIIFLFVWHLGLKRITYQHIYGSPDETAAQISMQAIRTDVNENKTHQVSIGDYDINVKLLKQFYVTAKVGYVDRYSGFLGRFYRNTDDGASIVYDTFVPQDVTILYGKTADENNLKLLDISHEYRMAHYKPLSRNLYFDSKEADNMHTIAGNKNIQKGLDILKKGDVATFEGYLIYWDTRLPSGRILDFTSAIHAGQISHQKAGGRQSILCIQLYLTRLSFDGYVFE